MLCGVRTGCPLSATLLLLCMNPFVDIINWLADGPKIAKTCLCADDIGSALKSLRDLKSYMAYSGLLPEHLEWF